MQTAIRAAEMPTVLSHKAALTAQSPFTTSAPRPLYRVNLHGRACMVRSQAKSKMHEFDLTQTDYRKTGMESEKVDGTVTRLWKFFFRPGEGYVDRYGFSVPMGPLDDVS